MSRERYFLVIYGSVPGEYLAHVEVSHEAWVRAERGAGFRPHGPDRGQCATGGFSSGSFGGRIEYEQEVTS